MFYGEGDVGVIGDLRSNLVGHLFLKKGLGGAHGLRTRDTS